MQALAAPVDDDAADRRIRADDKFCIVIAPSTDRRITQPLDFVQDVAQSRALEVGLVEVASAYQELEVACIFHFASPMGTVHEPYDSRATMPVSPTRSIGAGRHTSRVLRPFANISDIKPGFQSQSTFGPPVVQ